MQRFMGSYHSRIDAKGRVSIPAPFRTILRGGAPEGAVRVILRPSHLLPCVEAWPVNTFDAVCDRLEQVPYFSEDNEDLGTALFGDAEPVESDREGRIVLPDWVAPHAGLSGAVTFMGHAQNFRIWEPAAAAQRLAEARARALAKGLTLPVAAR